MREPSTILHIQDADWIDDFLDYLNDPNSFKDARDLHDEVENFRMDYWEFKNLLVKDFEVPKSIVDDSENLE